MKNTLSLSSPYKKDSLKIAILAHIRIPINEPFGGGMESFTHALAKKLIAKGHDVTVFASEGSDPSINPRYISPATGLPLPEAKYSLNSIEYPQYYECRAGNKILIELKKGDFDIIHNNSLYPIINTFSDFLPMPMVTTLHVPPFQWLAGSFEHSTNKNNTCVSVSNFMQKLWNPIVNSSIIMNGIDLTKFKYNKNSTKEDFALWFGRITPEKGTIYAIKAAQKAKIKLKICGDIYNTRYFENLVKPHIGNDIEYLGRLPHKEIIKLLGQAKICINTPCWDEAFGLVIAESLACGTPVAVFKRGAVTEVLDDKSGVFAKPNSVSSLTKAIIKAQKLKPEDCRKRAEEIADIDKMVSQYEALYRQLIAKQKGLINAAS